MENKQTIIKINEEADRILSKIENDTYKEEFSIKDLRFTGDNMSLNGTDLSGHAAKKICNLLKIKSDFGKYSKSMTESEWNQIAGKLKELQGDRTIIAQYKNEGKHIISNIFTKNTKKKHDDGHSLRSYFDMITNSLADSSIAYDFKGLNFTEKSQTFDLELLDRDTNIDVLNNGQDIWNGGTSFTFNPVAFKSSPFFERLICTNGMRSVKHGFGANIQQSKYNVNKISKTIQEAIHNGTSNLNEMIGASAQHLLTNNISLREFYTFRNIFLANEENPNFIKLATKFFDDSPIYKAYGMNLAEKSNKWKSTANTGINAYDFFNLITWIASHQKETGITDEESRTLQIKASELFFKDNLDLEDIATPVNVNYPRIFEMA